MTNSALTLIDWVIVILYFFLIIRLGLKFSKRQKNTTRYFLANRSLPGWAVGMSMFATIISSWSFIALPGKAYQNDLQYLITISTLLISAYLTAKFFIPLYRNKIKLSAYEFLEKRFGLPARIYGNLTFLIIHFAKMGAILYLLCMAISSMTGWNIYLLICLIGMVTIVYTLIGGIEGVVWSDVIQGFLLLGGGVISLFYILYGSSIGAEKIIEHSYDAGKLQLISSDFSWQSTGFYAFLFFGFNYFFQKYVSDQTVVQRFLLSPSQKEAGKALWFSSAIIMFVWILFMGLGALLWSFYDLQPGLLPANVGTQPDQVFPYFIGHQLPQGISGIILAGLMAATMSTLSSDLNSLSAVLLEDYYIKICSKRSDEQHLIFSRFAVLIAGLLGIILAMAMTQIKSMADAAANFVALLAGGILGIYLLGIFCKRCSHSAMYSGLIIGISFIFWTFLGNQTDNEWMMAPAINTLWIGLFGNIIVFVSGYLISRIFTPDYHVDDIR